VKWFLAVLLVTVSACSSAAPKAAPPTSTTSAAGTTTAAPSTTAVAAKSAPSASTPCQGSAPPAAYQHVVVIMEENRGLTQVLGSPLAPYVNQLGREGVALHYAGVSHPSLPNYIAITSGGTQGVSDDSGPSSHALAVPSIFSLLGSGWRSLAESMPSACSRSSGGEYAPKHNPAVYYTDLGSECPAQDVPMNDAVPDISARYTFITPNLCNDGHDCSIGTADRWLSAEMPRILDSAEYRSGRTVVFITWDENDSGGSLVPMYVIAPSVVPGTRSTAAFDHYSQLRTSEELLGLTPLLGAAAGAPSMRGAFHL